MIPRPTFDTPRRRMRLGAWRTLLPTACLLFATLLPTTRGGAEEAAEFQRFPVETTGEDIILDIATSTDGAEWLLEGGSEYQPPATLAKINAGGEVIAEFTFPGSVGAITRGLDGEMWFVGPGPDNAGESFLGRISPTGRIRIYPIPGPSGAPALPANLVVDTEGDVWVAAPGAGSIDRFGPNGVLLREYTTQNQAPTALAVAPGGDIWFTDGLSVGKIDVSSGDLEEHAVPVNKIVRVDSTIYVRAIVFGPGGDAWSLYTAYYEGAVNEGSFLARMEPSGAVTEYSLPNLYFAGFHGLLAGPDGDLWIGGDGEGLTRMTPSGETSTFLPSVGTFDYVRDLAVADDGSIWYTPTYADEALVASAHYHVWRFITPFPPSTVSAPTLSGATTVGETLTTTDGTWLHRPSMTSYQWQTCDAAGNGCTGIAGESTSSHVITGDDVGHTLRAVVTVSGPGASASAVSSPSSVVISPEQPTPRGGVRSIRALQPLPSVTATWRFDWSRRYTVVKSLIVHGLPKGAVLVVSCAGHGCAFHRRRTTVRPARSKTGASRTFDLSAWFRGRRLTPGATITITVSDTGHVEKYYVFAIRANRAPTVRIGCRTRDSTKVTKSC